MKGDEFILVIASLRECEQFSWDCWNILMVSGKHSSKVDRIWNDFRAPRPKKKKISHKVCFSFCPLQQEFTEYLIFDW